MIDKVALFCFRRRRLVVAVWVVAFVVLGVAQGAAGSKFRTEFRLPDTESLRGLKILETSFAAQGSGGVTGTIVFKADKGVADPAVQARMSEFFAAVAEIPRITVQSPYQPEGQGQVAQGPAGSPDAGKIAYANVNFPSDFAQDDFLAVSKKVNKLVPKDVAGLQIELGGDAFAAFEPPSSETIGLVFAIFILLIAFGSVLAMGLPVGVALAGIGSGIALVTLGSHLMKMPDFTVTLGAMIGLGVGIDYALFIVTRYREGLHEGLSVEQATLKALSTAGRAVLFAGVTVVISLLGMLLMKVSFVNGLSIGASVTVLMTMLASVTLLPALLGFAGHRVEVTRWRSLIAVGFLALALLGVGIKVPAVALLGLVLTAVVLLAGFFVPALKREVPRRAVKPMRDTFWYRWSRLVQRYPWPMMIGGLASLLLLAVPVLGLRLGFSDTGNYPKDTTTRRAYDMTVEGFGPGFNGPLILAAELPSGASPAALARVSDAVSATPGIVFTSPANLNDPVTPTAVQWLVVPATSPQDEKTTKLVHHLRDDVLPQVTAGTALQIAVTGNVAANIDFADYLSKRLPIFFGAVLALSFLLLMAVFRSILVPLKAVIMNLLSIAASYGVVVAVFQWGWGRQLVGIGKGGPIEAWAPMMMFAIVFGLSMDYEVFLLSRMREEFLRTGNNATAVADGLAATARVITAAGAIMVFVFGSFLLEPTRQIKLFGLGLAMSVFLDATIVRMVLVPATMELLGRLNWWMPAWLDRIVPKLNVEGTGDRVPVSITAD